MLARLLPPHAQYTGNLLWRREDIAGHEDQLRQSISKLTEMGYWASRYPEGDGVTFKANVYQSNEQILADFRLAFAWLDVQLGTSRDANAQLAELEELAGEGREVDCIVVVPLERVHLESSFALGAFLFGCRSEFQSPDEERLTDWAGAYVQFETKLKYADLLRVKLSVDGSDLVINKCLAIAESAVDVIRFQFSSFSRPEFTPNPAGQLNDGFFAVEIIPLGTEHLGSIELSGISRPMSASNNWLGPQIEDLGNEERSYLSEVLDGRSDDMALAVKAALRGCRQSFYSLGDEAKFLNLVFTLDGLAHPGKWNGWKQRTYIAALVSRGNLARFRKVLNRYETLYDIRNALVHRGRDFYQVGHEPNACCQDLYGYIHSLVSLIALEDVRTTADLRALATGWLAHPAWQTCLLSEITAICSAKGEPVKNLPTW